MEKKNQLDRHLSHNLFVRVGIAFIGDKLTPRDPRPQAESSFHVQNFTLLLPRAVTTSLVPVCFL